MSAVFLAILSPTPCTLVELGLISSRLRGFVGIVLVSSILFFFLIIAAHRVSMRDRRPGAEERPFLSLLAKWKWLIWLLLMTDVFLISNHLLVRGLAVGIWDVNSAYYPYQTLVADHARAGQFLHWDPWSNGGMAVGGDPQFGAFSPVNLLIGLIAGGTSTGFLIYWLAIWWLGGVGMMLLARHLGTPAWGGAVVSLGFLFGGIYIGQGEHTSLISAHSFLPFVVWRLDAALASRRMLPAIQAGAIWGVSALAGYPAIVIITGLFAGLWVVGRWLCGTDVRAQSSSESTTGVQAVRGRLTARFGFAATAVVPMVGILVLLPTYFAYFHEGKGTSTRVGALSREVAVTENALEVGAIASLSSPYFPILKVFSRTEDGKGLWPTTDVSGCAMYAGVIISAFALLALFNRPGERWRWWLLFIGLLNLAFAVGAVLPFRGWLYDWFYPARFFRHAAIFRAYFLFSIGVLALIGARDLATTLLSARDRIWRCFFAASTLSAGVALAVFYYYVNSPTIERMTREGESFAQYHALGAWLGMCVVAIIAWCAPARTKPWLVPLLLLTLATADALMTSSISTGIFADPHPSGIKRWRALDAQHQSSLDLTKVGLRRDETAFYREGNNQVDITNDQMITKIPAFNTYATATNNFHMVMTNDPRMRRMAVGTDRIWFSRDVGRMAPSDTNFALFRNRVQLLDSFPLVVHSSEEMLETASERTFPTAVREVEMMSLAAAEPRRANVIRYVPDELTFSVWCDFDGWLLVTDRWARSWRAEVNGSPAEVFGGNFIFRAIQVSAGESRISFYYHPRGFPWLVILSWATLAVVALASICSTRKRVFPSTSESGDEITHEKRP